MLDFSRLTDVFGDLLGQASSSILPADLLDKLGALGIDPPEIASLEPGQLITMLSEQGIDVSQLDASQLSALSEHLGLGSSFGDVLGGFADLDPTER